VEHYGHKEQSVIARSLELQGKFSSKPLFFIALLLFFFLELHKQGP